MTLILPPDTRLGRPGEVIAHGAADPPLIVNMHEGTARRSAHGFRIVEEVDPKTAAEPDIAKFHFNRREARDERGKWTKDHAMDLADDIDKHARLIEDDTQLWGGTSTGLRNAADRIRDGDYRKAVDELRFAKESASNEGVKLSHADQIGKFIENVSSITLPPDDRNNDNFIQLWHGTSPENAQSISRTGLMANDYSTDDPTLSASRNDAREAANRYAGRNVPRAVVDVRVPKDLEDAYLFPLEGHMGYRALKKPLPPAMIHGFRQAY